MERRRAFTLAEAVELMRRLDAEDEDDAGPRLDADYFDGGMSSNDASSAA